MYTCAGILLYRKKKYIYTQETNNGTSSTGRAAIWPRAYGDDDYDYDDHIKHPIRILIPPSHRCVQPRCAMCTGVQDFFYLDDDDDDDG